MKNYLCEMKSLYSAPQKFLKVVIETFHMHISLGFLDDLK